MSAESRANSTWGDSTSSAQSMPPGGRGRRFGLAMAAALIVAGAAWGAWRLIDRPGEPPDEAASSRSSPFDATAGSPRQSPAVDVPQPGDPPVRPSPNELLAEGFALAEQLVADMPDNAEAWCAAGRIYYNFNETAKAQSCWENARRQKPDSADALCGLGDAAWEHGDYQSAADHLKRAMTLSPAVGREKVLVLAESLLNLGRASEAVAELESATRHIRLTPAGISLLGHAYLECGRHAEAARCFEEALSASPDSARFHFVLARCYDKLKEPRKAEQHRAAYARLRTDEKAETAKQRLEMRRKDWADFAPFLRDCHTVAGKVYAKRGKAERAESQWRRALALDPDQAEPRALLVDLYRRQGRAHDALRVEPPR